MKAKTIGLFDLVEIFPTRESAIKYLEKDKVSGKVTMEEESGKKKVLSVEIPKERLFLWE